MGRVKDKSKGLEIELRADGWERFEAAVNVAAKSGPMRRTAKKVAVLGKSTPKRNGRRR
jgi:hypothetical protein